MEKYIIVLIILSMLLFFFCTFPVMNITADQTYLVLTKENYADNILTKSEKWQAKGYYVYKLAKGEEDRAKTIPNGKIVKEYVLENNHNLKGGNPFMQVVFSKNNVILGLPYVID